MQHVEDGSEVVDRNRPLVSPGGINVRDTEIFISIRARVVREVAAPLAVVRDGGWPDVHDIADNERQPESVVAPHLGARVVDPVEGQPTYSSSPEIRSISAATVGGTVRAANSERIEAEGYDTLVRPAAAFSTLGWFDDPLLRHLLESDDVFLVDLVLHETYHRTFFLKGANASSFNESVASFVGHRGALEFFAARGSDPALVREAEVRWADARRFARFMRGLVARLEALYAGTDAAHILAAREIVFAEARVEFDALPFEGKRYERFAERPLDNAVVLHYRMYASELDAFEHLWQQAGGLRPALDRIEAAAREAPDMPLAGVRAVLESSRAPTPP